MDNDYLALCQRDLRNELVAAECEHLTGARPDVDGLAVCKTLDHIQHAAYIRMGVQVIAQGKTIQQLTDAILHTSFDAEDFRIEYLSLTKKWPIDRQGTIIAVADVIPADPNLDRPKHRFLLVPQPGNFRFGEIMIEADYTYRQHEAERPYRTTSAIPSQIARAIVNLVIPSARSIIDPCCGSGSILLEASALGFKATGMDWNPRMVGMSKKNLQYFDYPVDVTLEDARLCTQTADAVVTNLPYGNKIQLSEPVTRDIMKQMATLAPLAVYVAGQDLTHWLRGAGYQDIEVFHVPKYAGFMRYIHRARSII